MKLLLQICFYTSITSCNKCDICKNYLICTNYFICIVTNRRYYKRDAIHCNCINVIYLITCKNFLEQYVGSATNFKNQINQDKYGTANHFNGKCKNDSNIFQNFMVMPKTLMKFYGTGIYYDAWPVIYYDSWHEQFD